MKEMGLKIGINGFKKEYIYLENLFQYPLHYVKLDTEYLKMIIDGKGDYKKIISFIETARKLNVLVVAENFGGEDLREKLLGMGLENIDVYSKLEGIGESAILNYLS